VGFSQPVVAVAVTEAKMMKATNKHLLLLTGAALSIPAPGLAGNVPEKSVISYQTAHYKEDSLEPNKNVTGGPADRYEISVNKFSLLTPVGDNATVSFDVLHETLSGASPWFNSESSNGSPVTTMSGASIAEQRNEMAVKLTQFKDAETHSVGLVNSQENDYSAQAFSYDYAIDLSKKNTTLSTGVSFSNDRIFPNQSTPLHQNSLEGIDTDKKTIQSVYFGVSQNINVRMIGKLGVSHTQLSGYLSDPYKLFDRRPDSRTQTVLSAGLRYFSSGHQAAYHLDYRYYEDDWGVRSDTLAFKTYINLQNKWQIAPGLRYYSQHGADFYSPFIPTGSSVGNDYHSEDFRLSFYGAVSYQLDVYKKLDNYRLKFSIERYESDMSYSQSNPAYNNPGLINFTMTSIGIDYYF